MSDAGQLPDGFEVELLTYSAFSVSDDVLRNHPALPNSVLRSGRAERSSAQIGDHRAVSQGPDTGPVWNRQFGGDLQPAALRGARQMGDQGMGHGARGPDEGLRRELLSIRKVEGGPVVARNTRPR